MLDLRGDALVGDDPRVVFRRRHEDEDAGPVARMADAADHELLQRRLMGARAPHRRRHQREAQRHPREDQAGDQEHRKLQQENLLHAPRRQIDQRPRHDERQHARPQDRHIGIVRRRVRQYAHDLARRALFGIANGGRDRLVILVAQLHHQLPDAPPPPDEPPPPENPPPPPPQSEEPPPQEPPLLGMKILRPPRPAKPPGRPPPAPRLKYQTMKMITRTNNSPNNSLPSGSSSSARTSTLRCHSALSPLSTLMMPSTPRSMPPEISLALKRGTIALEMMTEDNASVSVP